MHKNKLVVAIKNKGEVLKEFKDEIRIPFGAEYSIYIKNLNTVRALVSITIDGTDIGDGTKFIVQANDSIEIERFLKNGNMNEGNRLKFIERNAKVEQARGVQAEDGLIRVEFQFEKPAAKPIDFGKLLFEKTKEVHHHHYPSYPTRWYLGGPYYGSGAIGSTADDRVLMKSSVSRSFGAGGGATGSAGDSYNVTSQACNFTAQDTSSISANYSAEVPTSAPVNDVGITVEGSVSDQKFQYGSWFDVESESDVIVLRLVGNLGKEKVQVAVKAKHKQRCKTCKHVNKNTAKFCSECGTGLTIV